MGGPSAGRKVDNSRVGRIRGMVTGALRFGGGHYKIPLTGRLTTIKCLEDRVFCLCSESGGVSTVRA